MVPNHPSELAPLLRSMADQILATATDPNHKYTDQRSAGVFEKQARAIHRTANEVELIYKKVFEPALTLTDRQFEMLSRAIRSERGPAERAARLVLVQGTAQSEASAETGITQQSVYAAVQRYRAAWLEFVNANMPEE